MTQTLLLAAAMLGLQARTAPTTLAPEDVVVVGERMRRLKLETKTDRKTGSSRCVFKRRSGDGAFDTLMRETVLSCARTVTTLSQMEACIAPRVEAYARQLGRRAERQNSLYSLMSIMGSRRGGNSRSSAEAGAATPERSRPSGAGRESLSPVMRGRSWAASVRQPPASRNRHRVRPCTSSINRCLPSSIREWRR
jgi:hypothetical protein